MVQEAERTRILFFRQGAYSHINDRVAGWLRDQFPEQQLVQVDILQHVIKPARLLVAGSVASSIATYFPRIVNGDRDFRALFYRTPFFVNALRREISRRFAALARECLFSIQTQSLFDAAIPGLPHFLYTDHTHLANLTYPGKWSSVLYHPSWIAAETALYHRVTRNLVMSRFIHNSLTRDYRVPEDRIAIVGAAPNLPLPSPLLLPNNDGYGNRTILFVGVDWERKGGPVLIEAFRQILKRLPDARLIIAGCSPSINLPNVEILGRVPLPDVAPLLLRASVFAFPSWREPQGIASIEATVHGIPVVASNIAALPEVIADHVTGRIVPPGDAAALAAALLDILSNPALARQYGETARKTAPARFGPGAVGARLGSAIRSALIESESPAAQSFAYSEADKIAAG